jgi:hypothetical protein
MAIDADLRTQEVANFLAEFHLLHSIGKGQGIPFRQEVLFCQRIVGERQYLATAMAVDIDVSGHRIADALPSFFGIGVVEASGGQVGEFFSKCAGTFLDTQAVADDLVPDERLAPMDPGTPHLDSLAGERGSKCAPADAVARLQQQSCESAFR